VIDWLTLRAPIDVPVNAGMVCSFTADGVVEWHAPKRLQLEGSHSATIQVRRFPFDDSLEISGNPAKFLQGHNLFGSDDLPGLSRAFVLAVCARLGHRLTPSELQAIDAGLLTLTRIDCTQSWDFDSLPRALNVIRSLASQGYFAYRGRGSMTREGTVYWNQRSRRLAGKAYAKGHELQAHKLPFDLAERDRLSDFAQGLVRFEFTLRSMYLKRKNLHVCQNWPTLGVTPESIHAELMADLSVTANEIPGDDLEQLPAKLRLVYGAWKEGKDVRRYCSRATFYRYRKQLLPFGIDLAALQPSKEEPASNVVPMRVTLVGKPVSVPSWAIGTPLYFEPRKLAVAA
jgi:II/X family phage/plasmid replication protein